MGDPVQELRWSVSQRLEFIEFRLFWEGMIRRNDLTQQFDISVPQASGDLATYQQLTKENMKYDGSRKAYVPSEGFKSHFYNPAASDYFTKLRLIADGVCEPEETWLGWIPSFDVVPLVRRKASPKKLRRILRALRHKLALYIQYQSVSRPEPLWRWITPHGLGFDGFRWHVRAWCHRNEGFRDFVLARMISVDKEREHDVDTSLDREWQETVTFRIGPNPELEPTVQQAIELDYGMKDGELELKSRVCLSWYVETHLGLDLEKYDVPPQRQQIVLLNRSEVEETRKRCQRAY